MSVERNKAGGGIVGVKSKQQQTLSDEPPSPMSHAGILARHALYRVNTSSSDASVPLPAKQKSTASPRPRKKELVKTGSAKGLSSASSKFSFGKLFGTGSSSSLTSRKQDDDDDESLSLSHCSLSPSSYQISPRRPAVGNPLLPPRSDPGDKRITLVLDLDETLVRSSFDMTFEFDFEAPFTLNGCWCTARVRKRPLVDTFLDRVSKHFELIVMTAGVEPYASLVLDILDKNRVLDYRFYRDSCTKTDHGLLVKDLSRFNRPMDKIIIVDNSPNAYLWHPNNAVDIKDFVGDQRDTELNTVADFLETIKDAHDVRPHLPHWKKGKAYQSRYDKNKTATITIS